jgi:hypothetical protein
MNDQERSDLAELIDKTREILEWVTGDRGSKVPPYLRGPLRNAWTSVSRDRFIALREHIASGQYDGELDEHGLSGPELRAKLVAFNMHYLAWSNLERRTRRRRFRRPLVAESAE